MIEKREYPIYLSMRMRPAWVFIDELRRFTESFCQCACPGSDREAQLGLAVHELMQNAVPSAHGEEVELTISLHDDHDRIEITVTNRCTDEEFDRLSRRIGAMYDEPDALTHYLKAMRDTPVAARGGLGLARVRFEAQLDLSVTRVADRLTVHAQGKLRPPALQISGGNR